MNNIFFSSDFHYNHKNIVRGTSEWGDTGQQRTRNFNTLEEHNNTLIKNINNTIGKDDILYFLGDWSFGGFDKIMECRKGINCQNIHFIYGNHDHHIERNKEGIQEAFESCKYYDEITIEGIRIILSHYAFRVWNKSHHGSWMLYGHSHGTLDEFIPEITNPTWLGDQYYTKNYRTMDVGIDTHTEFRPYSFEELREIMNKRAVLLGIDHHAENTN